MVDGISPFSVAVPDRAIAELHERLRRTRWPQQLPATGWTRGADVSYVRALCEYWRAGFDWRAAEAELNAWPQFVTAIEGQRVHFLHVRSPIASATPLLLTHGWPGSIWEFLDVVGPLSDPVAHGGSPDDAFHVVCPSLPGYGWSGPTNDVGWDIQRVAAAEVELMILLGYERFGVQGGDWGAMASANIAELVPDRVIGLHLNLVMVPPPDVVDDQVGAAELQRRAHLNRYERGYSAIQSTKPLTIGYGLTDSPAALAAWIVEKFHAWTDCSGDLESVLTKDHLLRNIATYWFTDTAASSVRLYHESHNNGRGPLPSGYIDVPTGCAIFPRELWQPPRAWVEPFYNVIHWSEQPRGGHFAAMEQPAAFVDDVRRFFATVRDRTAEPSMGE